MDKVHIRSKDHYNVALTDNSQISPTKPTSPAFVRTNVALVPDGKATSKNSRTSYGDASRQEQALLPRYRPLHEQFWRRMHA